MEDTLNKEELQREALKALLSLRDEEHDDGKLEEGDSSGDEGEAEVEPPGKKDCRMVETYA